MKNKPIFLIGYMATGKSTLGQALATAFSRRFVDLDDAVEQSAGRSITAIFADSGEDAFRRLEAETLRRVAGPGTIVACGGGTPCHAGNMDFMLAEGLVVCLDATTDTIVRRLLEAPRGQRPLIDSYRDDTEGLRRHIEGMMEARRPHYDRAHAHFDGNRLETVGQIAASTASFAQQFNITNEP